MKPLHVLLVGIGCLGFALPATAQQYPDVSTEALIDRVVSGHLASPLDRINALERRVGDIQSELQMLKEEGPALQYSDNRPMNVDGMKSRQVKAHETLTGLARENGLTVRQLAEANNLSPDAHLQKGQWLLIPQYTPKEDVIQVSRTTKKSGTTYQVREGDTLSSIANQFGLSYVALQQANNLANPNRIEIGQVLMVPTAGGGQEQVQSAAPDRDAYRYYEVMPGDTVYSLSRKFFTSEAEILRLNNLPPHGMIRAGEMLIVPVARYYQMTRGNAI